MKNSIVSFANSLLEVFGARLVSTDADAFTMDRALERIAREHNFPFQSVIDIGASNGTWSEKAIHYFPDSYFLAIDPLFEREPALKKLQANYDKFRYALCVAGESNESVTLDVAEDLDGSTVTTDGQNLRKTRSKTLDTLVAENDLPPPYLLKFDTHGYELPILKGACETLAGTNIIIMEVYNFKITETSLRFHEMCSHLEKLGFRTFDLVDPMLRNFDKSLWQMDLFFCREDYRIFSHNRFR